MKIIRRDYTQGAGEQEQKLKVDELTFDRLIYRMMGSLTDNKHLATPDKADTDYNRWLLDMNNLHNYKYYNALYDGPTPTPDLIALDEYLGSLGTTYEYTFLEDTYDLEPWVSVDSQSEIRVLTDNDDTEYLIDPSDGTVLVRYR